MDENKTQVNYIRYKEPPIHKLKAGNLEIFLDDFKIEGVQNFKIENISTSVNLCQLTLTMTVEF